MKPIQNNRKPACGSAVDERLCAGSRGRNFVLGNMANQFYCAGADEVAAVLEAGLPFGALWLADGMVCGGNFNTVPVGAPFNFAPEYLSNLDSSDSSTGSTHQRHIRPKIASKLASWP
jgi:hypothetical protein